MVATVNNNVLALNEAIDRSFPFDIVKRQLEIDGRPVKHWGLFRTDDGACVGNAVKRGFEPHTKDDLKAMGESAITALGDMDLVISARWHNDTHKLIIGPTRDFEIEVAENDSIFPRFSIIAGNGTVKHRASGGMFRHLCTNLAELHAEGIHASFSMRHTRQLRERMPEMIQQFGTIASEWQQIGAVAKDLQSKVMEFRPFLLEVMPLADDASERTKQNWEDRFGAMVARITNERGRRSLGREEVLKGSVTGWEAWNAVQGFVQHNSRRRGNPGMLDRALMAMDAPVVDRALEVALAS